MPAPHRSLADALREASDDSLRTLLAQRPDLLSPLPEGIGSLAARAAGASSTRTALQRRSLPELQVIEALVVLPEPASLAEISHALDADPTAIETVLATLRDLALVWGSDPVRMVRSLREGLRHPAGLGPQLEEDPSDEEARALVASARSEGGRLTAALDALAWGPARLDAGQGGLATLLSAARIAVPAGRGALRIPRSVHLALRDGRVHRRLEIDPPALLGSPITERFPGSRTAQSLDLALESLRIASLLSSWSTDPPPVLSRGGLPQRELHRLVDRADAPALTVTTVLQSLGTSGLVTDQGGSWRPTQEGELFADLPESQRWAQLALTWARSEDLASLVGTSDAGGPPRPALSPATLRPGSGARRRSLLRGLAQLHEEQPDLAPDPASLEGLLAWHHPLVPPATIAEEVRAALREGEALGVLLDGRATVLGHALAGAMAASDADAAADAPSLLAESFTRHAPTPVDEVLLDADLTAVIPGRPSERLSALSRWTETVSRGGALTLRFTPASVRGALHDGEDPDALLAALHEFSRTPVPQALEVLLRDERRRHGRVAVHGGVTVLRAEAEVLAIIERHPAAGALDLHLLAPGIAVTMSSASAALRAIDAAGLSGVPVDVNGSPRSSPRAARALGPRKAPDLSEDRLVSPDEGVRRLRAADAGGSAGSVADLLHDAIDHQEPLRIGIVDGRGGVAVHQVLPLALEDGRLRARDLAEDEEFSVLVHRVTLG